MKTKSAILGFLAFAAATVSSWAGGPQFSVSINTGPVCRPAPVCAPVPVICRPIRTYYGCPSPAFYAWGPTVVVATQPGTTGFSTVTSYAPAAAPVYRVPPPVIQTQPITVYPTSFGWRR